MSQNFHQPISSLRQQAEKRLAQTPFSSEKTDELFYELEVHQIELEMQHEALEQANDQLQRLY